MDEYINCHKNTTCTHYVEGRPWNCVLCAHNTKAEYTLEDNYEEVDKDDTN